MSALEVALQGHPLWQLTQRGQQLLGAEKVEPRFLNSKSQVCLSERSRRSCSSTSLSSLQYSSFTSRTTRPCLAKKPVFPGQCWPSSAREGSRAWKVVCQARRGPLGQSNERYRDCDERNVSSSSSSDQIRSEVTTERTPSSRRQQPDNGGFDDEVAKSGNSSPLLLSMLGGLCVAGALALAVPAAAHAKGRRAPSLTAAVASATAVIEKETGVKTSSAKTKAAQVSLTEEDVANLLTSESEETLIPLLQMYVKDHPEDLGALKTLLKYHMQEGQFEEGLKVLELLIEKDSDQMEWQLVKAQAKEFMGDLEGAREGYRRVLEKEPFSARAMQGLATVMQRSGEHSLVLGMLEETIQKASQDGKYKADVNNLKLVLGQMHTLQGNVAQALQQYDELIKDDPNDFRPYLCQGLVYSLVGNKEQADESFKQFQKRCPDDYTEGSRVDSVMVKAKAAAKRLKDAQKREAQAKAKGRRSKGPMIQPGFNPGSAEEE